jgi:hypothetical protein
MKLKDKQAMVSTVTATKRVVKSFKIKEVPTVHNEHEETEQKLFKLQKSGGNYCKLDRMKRALTQRMYLVHVEDLTCIETGFCKKYAMLGSTGNVYDVEIRQIPTCSCPCDKGRFCKHIIFVLMKVLYVPKDSELVYRSVFTQSELGMLFNTTPMTTTSLVHANHEVVKAYKTTFCLDEKNEEVQPVVKAGLNGKVAEGDCPVCFEDLVGEEPLDSCSTCRNFVHTECLKRWLAVQMNCCYCRTDWLAHCVSGDSSSSTISNVVTAELRKEEKYVNLGEIQGLSGQRDTSSYNKFRGGGVCGRYGHVGYFGKDF